MNKTHSNYRPFIMNMALQALSLCGIKPFILSSEYLIIDMNIDILLFYLVSELRLKDGHDTRMIFMLTVTLNHHMK